MGSALFGTQVCGLGLVVGWFDWNLEINSRNIGMCSSCHYEERYVDEGERTGPCL